MGKRKEWKGTRKKAGKGIERKDGKGKEKGREKEGEDFERTKRKSTL